MSELPVHVLHVLVYRSLCKTWKCTACSIPSDWRPYQTVSVPSAAEAYHPRANAMELSLLYIAQANKTCVRHALPDQNVFVLVNFLGSYITDIIYNPKRSVYA